VARLVAYSLLRDPQYPRIPLVPCTSLAVGREVFPQEGDWALAFSHRGRNRPTLAALEACEAAGAHTVFVTAQGAAEPRPGRFLLPTGALERCEPHSIAITGAVCAATTFLLGEKAAAEWREISLAADPDLTRCREEVGPGPDVILGEGIAEWVAREGALKFIEMARHPVRAYGSEEFFHVTSWCMKPGELVWHLALPEDPRSGEIEAARRFPILSATPLAWVNALIELQWLALALALNRGEDPDDPIGAVEKLKKQGK
jgi:fructoselysine-6-P-deglycase FrlB-like protein